ncbi:MAG: acetyl-CoA carboxylase biotin carboxylase subunit [Alphaproteobacteria bacterium]|nr:acetyl-CoA carboxylase biotin carboxylase subunit [Alphaproteobacteria bacterium]
MTPTPFSSILIANRGEIACRIMRSAREMGLRSIAVYSDADAHAPHVKMADAAFRLGPAPAAQSYLDIERIIDAARNTGAEAIHPGYGFLSENAAFAAACAKAGIVFIGPAPDAIALMGDKAKAKQRMIAAGVACIPGYHGAEQSDDALTRAAGEVGFPLMVKAASGGGGRGMRLVEHARDLAGALKSARSEAENAFGAGELILERAILRPRHVEIQIFADRHGNVVHLGERDCSVQRRHQKVLEEAPCPVMTPALREKMGAAAVKAARDINYLGAGTVEFLLDSDGAFYFLEMNTRLQVEHPVTEMVTDRDLVALQIRVAQGEALGFSQEDVALAGHAIEARLYAEDVAQGFLPAAGPVDLWRPATAPGIRIDAGIATGGDISSYYDPMIAKIIAHGPTRDEARRKLIEALKRTTLFGVATNKKFLIDALERPAFAKGEATTAFIAETFSNEDLAAPNLNPEDAACAVVLLYETARARAISQAVCASAVLTNWSSATKITTPYRFVDGDKTLDLNVTPVGPKQYHVEHEGRTIAVEAVTIAPYEAVLSVDGARQGVSFDLPDDAAHARIQISIDGRDFELQNRNAIIASTIDSAGAGAVVAPMHGMLVEICVAPGQKVARGTRLAVLEAMKMQHELHAEIDGVVTDIHFDAGVQISANALIMEITAE